MQADGTGIEGTITLELFDKNLQLKARRIIKNLITDAGDLYYATRGIASVVPGGPSQPTLVTGMKLGTGEQPVTISAATNASPIVLTTSTQSWSSGDKITVTGVGGNTAANGTWILSAATSTTATLTGSTGNAAYTSGGTAQRQPTKAGALAALVTYTSALTMDKVFDASFPSTVNLGSGLGVQAKYVVTFSPGQATSTLLSEVAIVNDAATDATSTAANTISKATFATINKQAADTLVATWTHKFLGA
jgi:hypothetical protein